MATTADWTSKAATKRANEFAKIPSAWHLAPEYLTGDETSDLSVLDIPAKCGILSNVELQITGRYDAITLARLVQSGGLRAVDVATAFCKRAAIAQQLTNCLTEIMFDDAIKRGEWLDQYLAEHGKPVGPFHGVPISIKDPFNYKGVQATLGFVSYIDHPPAQQNSPLVDMLLELGAILYCKTNIPQTMMTGDSHNNVFGRVRNPHKLKLGAGGSSGGEGALVAMRGSVLGVGTDIAGSIRIPALCNGTYGFKPSSNRIPYGGQARGVRGGTPGYPAVAGPLTNSFEDMHFFLRHVIDAKPWDRDDTAISMPWRSSTADRTPPTLRIGYLACDSEYNVQPPVVRALDATVKKLAAAGFTIVALASFPSLKTSVDLSTDYFSLDNSKTFMNHINSSGEPMIPSLAKTQWTVNKKPSYSLDEVFDLNVAKAQYKAAWHKLWVDNKLDIILCPPAETTAVLHDTYGFPPYTVVWSLLEYPAVILPVGKADQSIDTDELALPSVRQYRSADVHGAPTTIQLVGRGYQDEELIAAASLVDKALKS